MKLCVRVPFYGSGYPCYSFCSFHTSSSAGGECISTILQRLHGGSGRFNYGTGALCVNKKAPSILTPSCLYRVVGNTGSAFLASSTRVAMRYGPFSLNSRFFRGMDRYGMGELSVNLRSTGSNRHEVLNEQTNGDRIRDIISQTGGTKVGGVSLSMVLNIPNRAGRDLGDALSFYVSSNIPRLDYCVLGVRRGAPFFHVESGLPFPSSSSATSVCLFVYRCLRGRNVVRCRVSGFTIPNFRDHRGLGC